MKASWYDRLGPAQEVLQSGDLPDPEPGPGDVRVRIAWSGVNPSDVKRRAGSGTTSSMPFPRVIPDQDGSGVIDRVGPGVDPARIGERVWLHSTCWGRPGGTAAELAITASDRAIRLPDTITLEGGATLGVPALTAHRAVFGCGSVAGRTVLVTGGAGAVGFYAIQLAKWAGARVITTVSGDAKAALAAQAGADHVINYRTGDVAVQVLDITRGVGVDHIVDVDFGGNIPTTLKIIRNNGSVASYASMGAATPTLPFYAFMQKNVHLLWVLVYELSRQALDDGAREVNAWLASGRAVLPPLVRFPLARLVDAHVAVEQAAVGKVVVEVAGG